MPTAGKRDTEAATLAALRALEVLDTGPEEEFDALVRAASTICRAPISLISLIDAERQWFKANVGLPGVSETPRDVAFCAHAVLGDEIFEVPDATRDARFADNPLVAGQPDIRFYAGAPIRLTDGSRVGTLCVIDREPRVLDETQREVLRLLAVAVARALEGRHAIRMTRQAAVELAASEARFRTLSDSSPHGVFHTDADGACTYTNARWQVIYGLTLQQSLGHGWAATLHPEDRTAVYDEWTRSAARGIEFDMEYRIVHPDGGVRHVHSRSRRLFGRGNEIVGHVGSVEDVSERLGLLARLATKQERLRDLYEASPAMLHSIDPQGRLIAVSDAWLAKLGFARDEVIGRRSVDFMTPASRDAALSDGLPALFRDGRRENAEFEMISKSGETIDVLLSATVEYDAEGVPLRVLAVVEDVTLRRRAERELAEERLRLANIIDGTGIGTWEWNVRTGEIRANERWTKTVGYSVEELAPLSVHTWRKSIHPDDLARSSALLEQHVAGATDLYEAEMRVRHRDGHWVWTYSCGRIMSRTVDGQAEWMFGIRQDVTERKQREESLRKSELFLERTGKLAGVGGWEVDLATGDIYWSPETCRIHGVAPGHRPRLEEVLGFYPPAARSVLQSAVETAMSGGPGYDLELPFVRLNGERVWVRTVGTVEFVNGKPVRRYGALQDVTESRRLAAELGKQHELLRVTLQSIGDAVITTDADGNVTWLNPVAERMTGWPTTEAQGRPFARVFHIVNEETRQATENPVALCLAGGAVAGLADHTVLISRDGEEFGIEDSVSPIRDAQGELLGVVLVFHDMTEQRRLSGEMSYRASHDALTGLVNRAEFESRLGRLLDKAHEDRGEHALLYIDLDQFKLVNDACGHGVGDHLLQQVSRLLGDALRARDTLARLGGDEFAIILEHCKPDQAMRVGQQICDRMDDFRFIHDGRRFRTGTSIGLVPVDSRWSTTTAILQAADTACYAAKEAGRNRVHAWFDTDLAIRARSGEMQWASRIEQALDENRFVLFAQRIMAVRGEPGGVHAEVLLRLIGTDGALVPPGAFLPAAERFHLVSRIDRWVLRHAIDWMQSVPDLTSIENLSVNLSGQSIGDRAFHRWANEVLTGAGADIRARLCFEITETAAVTNLADAAAFIEQVRAAGVRVALDDFGAGASSFGYLKTLPVDFLKIDGQFIRDLVTDPLDEAAVRCFADVAKVVGIKTVAEFVDNEAVLARLRTIGIDFAQGVLLHRPVPIDELLALGCRAVA